MNYITELNDRKYRIWKRNQLFNIMFHAFKNLQEILKLNALLKFPCNKIFLYI